MSYSSYSSFSSHYNNINGKNISEGHIIEYVNGKQTINKKIIIDHNKKIVIDNNKSNTNNNLIENKKYKLKK